MAVAMPVFRPKQSDRLAAHVELAAAHVDPALGRLAEGDDAGVEPVDERAEGQEIQRAVGTDVQAVFHCRLLMRLLVRPTIPGPRGSGKRVEGRPKLTGGRRAPRAVYATCASAP